ncbi:MAG: hypothetical protein KatS3mg109_0164 [Pirellulaceae bacterium]|nr:MAG: hypothetical protein KatS3mg109_0164 [Pirellulaceae bacterium]
MRPKLKLKPGTSQEKRLACELIRHQYAVWRSAYNAARRASKPIYLEPLDNPPESHLKQCVWADWYDRLVKHVNPLWAVRYDIEEAIQRGLPLVVRGKLQKVKKSDGSVVSHTTQVSGLQIASTAKIPEYQKASRYYLHEQKVKAENTVPALGKRLKTGALIVGSNHPEILLDYIKRDIDLDPVLELCWRAAQSLEIPERLLLDARCAYASYPALYGEVPEFVKRENELYPLFEDGNDDIRSCPPVRITGMLHS